jgi:class 3 adenylate cyclase
MPLARHDGKVPRMQDRMHDFSALGMTEIIRLQNALQQELVRRFERRAALVFSDIADSTSYFERFGDAAGRQLQQLHLDLLAECLPARQGRIVDTAGDGAFLAFAGADAAVEALIDFQQRASVDNATRAREHQLQLRIGAHWGPVLTDGTTVTGDSVNLCARVAASARSGEMRITSDLYHELEPRHRLHCRPLGLAHLKGVSREVELLALDWRDRSVFPARVRLEETGEEVELPQQDIVSFGRLRELEGRPANEVVLTLPDALQAQQISRWHFELRRFAEGYRLRPVSDAVTEVDGAPVAKGREVAIRPGTVVRVGRVLSLRFLAAPAAAGAGTTTTRLAERDG